MSRFGYHLRDGLLRPAVFTVTARGAVLPKRQTVDQPEKPAGQAATRRGPAHARASSEVLGAKPPHLTRQRQVIDVQTLFLKR